MENHWGTSGENNIFCINFANYNIMHCDLSSQNFVQKRCTHAFTTQVTDPSLLGGILTWRSRVTRMTELKPKNLQIIACRIELADLGLNFPLDPPPL